KESAVAANCGAKPPCGGCRKASSGANTLSGEPNRRIARRPEIVIEIGESQAGPAQVLFGHLWRAVPGCLPQGYEEDEEIVKLPRDGDDAGHEVDRGDRVGAANADSRLHRF